LRKKPAFVVSAWNPQRNINAYESLLDAVPKPATFLFEFLIRRFAGVGAGALTQIKIAVKQAFDNVDSIIFEAALTLNAIETRNKQMEYIS
jgi:hypothetical protein